MSQVAVGVINVTPPKLVLVITKVAGVGAVELSENFLHSFAKWAGTHCPLQKNGGSFPSSVSNTRYRHFPTVPLVVVVLELHAEIRNAVRKAAMRR